jgi:hypothetical protein
MKERMLGGLLGLSMARSVRSAVRLSTFSMSKATTCDVSVNMHLKRC